MITLITGGSKCGKSSFAERMLESFIGRKIYIATMRPFGDDAFEAIERHRVMRDGKGFETIEKYTDIHEISLDSNCAVLLECVGNLCANEMFSGDVICRPNDKIVNGIRTLSHSVSDIVVVSNQVGCDGISYSDGTSSFIRSMGEINQSIARIADNVIECVYGIPVLLKGEMPC